METSKYSAVGMSSIMSSKSANYKHRLDHAFIIQTPIFPEEDIDLPFTVLLANGKMILFKGYAWNGANVIPDTKSNHIGSAVHDAFYQLFEMGLLDSKASQYCGEQNVALELQNISDLFFEQICVKCGTWEWVAHGYYIGLKYFGWKAAQRKENTNKVDIYSYPLT